MRISEELQTSHWPEIWQSAYRILETKAVSSALKTWLPQITFQSVSGAENGGFIVTFRAMNDFISQIVKKTLLPVIEESFTQVLGAPCTLNLVVDPENINFTTTPSSSETTNPYTTDDSSAKDSHPGLVKNVTLNMGFRTHHDHCIYPRYTFENFIVGASNQFAHASSLAIAERPGSLYNPVFIYSPPGLGKTHLLHAIGNKILQVTPQARVVYLSAEQFLNELVDSIQKKKMAQFRDKYRNSVDALLLDDVQFLSGKEGTQEELFHTFNEFYNTKRQIVLTSDRPPKEIEELEERIQTRFAWGLISNINAPEIETRIAILKAKSEREDIFLPDEVATYMATYIKSNVRELESIVIKLKANASFLGTEISLEMAKQELRILVPEESSHHTVEAIQNTVAKHFNIKVQDLKSDIRATKFSIPRHVSMYLCRKYSRLGFKEIGSMFGGKDHSTVLHACKKIERLIEKDPSVLAKIEEIQNSL